MSEEKESDVRDVMKGEMAVFGYCWVGGMSESEELKMTPRFSLR